MQTLNNEVKQLQDALKKKRCRALYISYDELQLNYMVMGTKMKATKLKETNINKWWNLLHGTRGNK